MRTRRCLYLVDTLQYVTENCFQSQLYSAIRYGYEISPVELFPTSLFQLRYRWLKFDQYDRIISVLRLRTLHQHWPRLQKWLAGRPVSIYDQDPWENYIDSAPTKGVYQTLCANLNVEKVYVTAPWWARRLREDGVPAEFVRMGMEPAWCDPGPEFDDRPVYVGFRGAIHEHRQIVFNKLKQIGVQVEIGRERLSYPAYMDYLQQLKFFAHDESALPLICNGEPVPRSTGMWVKSVETAARGTFCLRDYHEEGEAYNLASLPLIRCYTEPEQVPEIINEIANMSSTSRRELQVETVNQIRRQYDWLETAHIIATASNSNA